MALDRLAEWMSGYRRAWESNSPGDIAALFTEAATYRYEPFSAPLAGRDAIVESWIGRADGPGETTFTWAALADTDEVSIVQGTTVYSGGPTFSNLWVIRLDADGRAREFTEWWMDQSKAS